MLTLSKAQNICFILTPCNIKMRLSIEYIIYTVDSHLGYKKPLWIFGALMLFCVAYGIITCVPWQSIGTPSFPEIF